MGKIGIIGTGLIGTSLGLAIKRAGIKDAQIAGTDRDRGRANKAQSMGAIDHVEGRLASAAEDADIVFIATPVTAMKEIMEIIGPRLKEDCLVTDTGGAKRVVMEWAEQYLPRSVSFVGGHPMVAKGGSGPEAADAALFADRTYCLIPGARSQRDAVKLLTDIIQAIGAKPYFIDIVEHDSFVSAVSQLPILLSVALVGCTSKSASWSDIAAIASTPYKESTGQASGAPVTSRDIFASDNEGVVHWIDSFIHELYEIRRILVSDEDGRLEALENVFAQAIEARNRWLAGAVTPASRQIVDSELLASTKQSWTDLFVGSSQARQRLFGSRGIRAKNPKDPK